MRLIAIKYSINRFEIHIVKCDGQKSDKKQHI